MPFNFTKKIDFVPKIKLPDAAEALNVVYETKLLGIICTSDGKWSKNTKYIVKRAMSKIWMLRILKWLGADKATLLESYNKFVRSLMETSAPLWHSSLTSAETDTIERVQKVAFVVLSSSSSYKTKLLSLGEKTLKERRLELCRRFA